MLSPQERLSDPIDNDRHYDMYYYPNLFTDIV